jgi:hypothetical protein
MANFNLKSEVLSNVDYFNVKNNSKQEFNDCLEYVITSLLINNIGFNEDDVKCIVKEYFSNLNK